MKIKWNGLVLCITYPEGSVRTGTDKQGNNWAQRMPFSYGYIQNTKGTDGTSVDVILSDDVNPADTVYVAVLPKNKEGEDKVLIGFDSLKTAKSAFLSCYGGDVRFLKNIYALTVRSLKKKLKSRQGLNLSANYNTAPFGMNNYVMEVAPADAELGKDLLDKYNEDSLDDKAFNKKLLTRQRKSEVVEQPTLSSNPNDMLDYYMMGNKEKI